MGKIIITGPGRSGTSFLVQLLTRTGFDTGYEPYQEPYVERIRAGCEHRIGEPGENLNLTTSNERWIEALAEAPRVLKSPEFGLVLKEFMQRGIMEVDHVYIPLRDLDVAAQSRLDAGLPWQVSLGDCYEYRVEDQANVHALAFGRAHEACLMCDLPYTIMLFPRFVQDIDYCYEKITEGVEIDRGEFNIVFAGLAKPEKIKWA